MTEQEDSLDAVVEAMRDDSYRLPLWWVVRWSTGGSDPILAAWNASQNVHLMEVVVTSSFFRRDEISSIAERLSLVMLPGHTIGWILREMERRDGREKGREKTVEAVRELFRKDLPDIQTFLSAREDE